MFFPNSKFHFLFVLQYVKLISIHYNCISFFTHCWGSTVITRLVFSISCRISSNQSIKLLRFFVCGVENENEKEKEKKKKRKNNLWFVHLLLKLEIHSHLFVFDYAPTRAIMGLRYLGFCTPFYHFYPSLLPLKPHPNKERGKKFVPKIFTVRLTSLILDEKYWSPFRFSLFEYPYDKQGSSHLPVTFAPVVRTCFLSFSI
jgi:hypothetical protein